MEASKRSSTHGENVEAKPNGLLLHEDVQLSPEETRAERRLVWKIDLIILPLLSLMYFLAALDRGDVSNAEVAGMGTELALTASQYSHCVSFFFIGYIVFQPPGQLLMRKVQPHIQLGTALIGWGLCTTLICLAQNWQTVAGLRILVGCFEAFIQAAPLYLSIWYKREELATRGAIFFSMMAIAGTMNGLIAYGIQIDLNNVHGWLAWRWIFLVEGIVSIGSGFFVMALLPPVPERAHRFFTAEEKQIAIRRSKQAFNTPHTGVKLKQLRAVLTDHKVWFYVFFYSMMNISLSGFSSFLPLIVQSFGYSRVTTQILTIPVYIAAAISTIGFAVVSDRMRNRGNILTVSFAMAGLGWLFLIVSKSKGLSLAGCFFAGMGTYPTVVLIQAWQTSNVIGFTKRAGALAFLMVFGQSFGVMEVEIFTDRPSYYRGKGFALGATAAAALVTPLFQLYLKRKNAEKLANRDTDEAAARRRLGIEEIGDEHPDFMYWL